MTKINTVANNGLTIVENYNKLLEQFRNCLLYTSDAADE